MSGQGYHFAIDRQRMSELLACKEDFQLVDWIHVFLEDRDNLENTHGGYKEWDVLHRCLSDGTFDPKGGTYPLNRCFLGGRLLMTEGSIVNVVLPEDVQGISETLARRDRTWFHRKYLALFPDDFEGDREEHFEEVFRMFEELRAFYRKASSEGKAIGFYTDDCLSYFFKDNSI
jgi:hypothetical protein